MASTFGSFEIAKSGMMAYNNKLQVVAHNVANIETKGYSKQVTNITSVVGQRNSFAVQGYGVETVSITRTRSEYFDTKFQQTQSKFSKYETEAYYLNSLQDAICGDVTADNKSRILDAFDDFYAALSNLKGKPNDKTVRTQAVEVAQTFTKFVNDMATKMQQLQEEANVAIKTCVDQINAYAERITSINKQINTIEMYGATANDLRDQRSQLIDELSKICNVEVVEEEAPDGVGDPQYCVYINGGILVDTYRMNQLEVVQKDTYSNINDIEGCYNIRWSNGADFPLHNNLMGGQLQGLIEMRDGNNSTALEGVIGGLTNAPQDEGGNLKLTLTDGNCNDVQLLNIPASNGEIIVSGRTYAYDSFEVKVGADGKFTYEFTLSTKVDAADAKVLQNAMAKGYTVSTAERVEARGIPYYMAQLNEFVRTFAKEFNTIQNEGLDLHDEKGIDFFNAKVPATGENYVMVEKDANGFDPSFSSTRPQVDAATGKYVGSYYYMTAANFCVTDEMIGDPGKIAGKLPYDDGSETGNDQGENIERLTKLKDKSDMFVHGAPDDFIRSLTASLGVNGRKAISLAESQGNLLYAIDTNRQSISGVDEDEEGANMIIFNHMLTCQYKVLSVLNEVLDKLINGTAV